MQAIPETWRAFIETDLGFMWHMPIVALLESMDRRRRRNAPDPEVHERKANIIALKELISNTLWCCQPDDVLLADVSAGSGSPCQRGC